MVVPGEKTSAGLPQKLMSKGYGKVYALRGGWDEWKGAGLPIEANQ
jgi:rhodanese-related sulfurtransferase